MNHIFRTVKILILSSEPWLFAQWAASAWIRSQSICVNPWGSVWKMKIRTWGRPLLCALQSCMTLTLSWWRTKASWTPSKISSLTPTPWYDSYGQGNRRLRSHLDVMQTSSCILLISSRMSPQMCSQMYLHSSSLGRSQRGGSSVWDSRVSPQQQSAGPEPSDHQQVADSFKRVYRVGTDIHPRLPRKLHTSWWPWVPKVGGNTLFMFSVDTWCHWTQV